MILATKIVAECLLRARDPEHSFYTYNWAANARTKQKTPAGNWSQWLILAGRGFGKSRTGAEFIREAVETSPEPLRIALIGETAADLRDTMIEGGSGLLAVSPPWFKPIYNPSKRKLTWPDGSIAHTFSAEAPEQLRGPAFNLAWIDEPAKMRYLEETVEMLEFGLRLKRADNKPPQIIITGTPKPIRYIKKLLHDDSTVVTIGSTYENEANLSSAFLAKMREKYEGTTLGDQELHAKILDNVDGALFSSDLIKINTKPPKLAMIVVAVDPPGGATECGIVVVGVDKIRLKSLNEYATFFVLEDRSFLPKTATEWAMEVAKTFDLFEADKVVAERNFGGDMVQDILKNVDPRVPIVLVTATRGKVIRATPVVSLYEQNRVFHVGNFIKLKEEMTTWIPEYADKQESPNRLDALVWGVAYLNEEITGGGRSGVSIA